MGLQQYALCPIIRPMQPETMFSVSDNAVTRLSHLLAGEAEGTRLRVAVDGGGCSGFQYRFDFDTTPLTDEDVIIERAGGVQVVIDKISLDYLKGSQLDYVESLGAAAFEIKNPNATSSCGCGNSFAV